MHVRERERRRKHLTLSQSLRVERTRRQCATSELNRLGNTINSLYTIDPVTVYSSIFIKEKSMIKSRLKWINHLSWTILLLVPDLSWLYYLNIFFILFWIARIIRWYNKKYIYNSIFNAINLAVSVLKKLTFCLQGASRSRSAYPKRRRSANPRPSLATGSLWAATTSSTPSSGTKTSTSFSATTPTSLTSRTRSRRSRARAWTLMWVDSTLLTCEFHIPKKKEINNVP